MSPDVSGRRRRAVLYGRVSKALRVAPGGTTDSVDQQLDVMLAQAAREDVTVVGPFRDDGVSASRYAKGAVRDGWKHTMEAIVSGEVDELWAWEMSRATRDRPVWSTLVNACIAQRVLISVGGRLHDPLDPDDGFMLDLMAALAVRESAQTSKRILRDVKARADVGKPHGKIPYAYRREYDPDSGALLRQVPNAETVPVVQEMVRRVLAGESMYAVSRDLNRRGVPSPETVRQRRLRGEDHPLIPWHASEVKDQLVSPTNAGLRVHQGTVLTAAAWPAVISAVDHAALEEKLVHPGQRAWKDGGTKHLLSGVAKCGVCGAPMRQGYNRTYPSYMCKGWPGQKAFCVARRQEPVDYMIEEAVIGYCGRPDVRAAIFAATADSGAAAAQSQLVELQARLGAFIASAAAGGVSPESLAALEGQLRPQIADAQRRATPRSLPGPVVALLGDDPRTVWTEELDVSQRRQAVRFLMEIRILKSARGLGARGFDPSRVAVRWLVGPDAAPSEGSDGVG